MGRDVFVGFAVCPALNDRRHGRRRVGSGNVRTQNRSVPDAHRNIRQAEHGWLTHVAWSYLCLPIFIASKARCIGSGSYPAKEFGAPAVISASPAGLLGLRTW